MRADLCIVRVAKLPPNRHYQRRCTHCCVFFVVAHNLSALASVGPLCRQFIDHSFIFSASHRYCHASLPCALSPFLLHFPTSPCICASAQPVQNASILHASAISPCQRRCVLYLHTIHFNPAPHMQSRAVHLSKVKPYVAEGYISLFDSCCTPYQLLFYMCPFARLIHLFI